MLSYATWEAHCRLCDRMMEDHELTSNGCPSAASAHEAPLNGACPSPAVITTSSGNNHDTVNTPAVGELTVGDAGDEQGDDNSSTELESLRTGTDPTGAQHCSVSLTLAA